MSWLVALAQAAVAGTALGLVAAATQLARRRTGRLDLVPVLAGTAVALAAARMDGTSQLDRIVDGLLLVPLAGVAGALVNLVVADRPRNGSVATRAVLVPVAVFVVGQSALRQWADDDTSVASARASGLRLDDRLIVSWTDLIVAVVVVGAVALLGAGVSRGRLGLRVRAAQESTELLPLVGIEPSRLEAALAGLGAAAGALGGLLFSVTGTEPVPGAFELAVRVGESLLLAGGVGLLGALTGGILLELARAVGDQVSEGWGPATGHALTLAVVGVRWLRGVRTRSDDEPAAEEVGA